jgi:hypothetical protein
VVFFAFGGVLVPFDSPSLTPAMIIGVFFLFPLLFVPATLAFVLSRRCRQADPRSARVFQFYECGGFAFICFGVTALLRSMILREAVGVQFMPIGFGLAICIGMVIFHKIQNEWRRG